jgi:pyruvate/2-oxoglutarate dehydrogenase complex dihydrolipoamide dehydrogenase (E3) component
MLPIYVSRASAQTIRRPRATGTLLKLKQRSAERGRREIIRAERCPNARLASARVHSASAEFHPETLKLLGIHAIGQRATEIIHVGSAVLAFGSTIEYFRDAVFNYPTLAEAHKVAALNGLNKL